MTFKAPSTLPGLQPEAERALGKVLNQIEVTLGELGAGQLVTTLKNASYTAELGEFVRTTPPAAGLRVLLPIATKANQGRTILVSIESVASGGTVTLAVVGGSQKVNNASTVVTSVVGLLMAISTGVGWATTLLSAGGGGTTPTGTGFRHVTAGVEDAASKLVDTADINNNQVTHAKEAQPAANTLVGNPTAGVANLQDIAVGANTVVGRVAGNIVAAALVNAQITANTITHASEAQPAANTIAGNWTAGAANMADNAVGANTVVGRVAGNVVAAALVGAQVTAATLPLTTLATQAATTVVANNTAGVASPTAVTFAALLTALAAFSNFQIQSFTASGTYTPTSGMKFCLVFGTGAGGGGGGADTSGAVFSSAVGGGGAAGGTAISRFTAATIGASQVVTLGTAGLAGANTGGTGGTGGTTTLGALLSAAGGAGGVGSGANVAASFNFSAGGSGGTPATGTVLLIGGDGAPGWAVSTDGTIDSVAAASGSGGGSMWGTGARGVSGGNGTAGGGTDASSAGVAGRAFGSGGSGAFELNVGTGQAGGAGAGGYMLVLEFI